MGRALPKGREPARASAGLVLLALAGVVAAVFLAFWPALSADFVNFDDPPAVLNNPHIRELSLADLRWMLSSSWLGHWHPLTWLSFALDYQLSGLDPHAFHFTNLALHAGGACLFLLVLLELLGPATRGARDRLALGAAMAGALLFAIHPLRVESVAWITERRDVLSGLFWMATLLLWLRARAAPTREMRWGLLALSLGCFALSLLSKAWGITLPATLLVLEIWPLRRRADPAWMRHALLEVLPYAALALGAAIAASWAQGQAGAAVPLSDHTPEERVLQACYGLCFYVGKTVLPLGLYPAVVLGKRDLSALDPPFGGSLAAVLVIALGLAVWRRRFPAGVVACAIYAITAAPILGFRQSGIQLVADRYSYLACVPWAALAGAGLLVLARRAAARGKPPLVAGLITVIALGALVPLTRQQTAIWKDSETLWNHTLRLDPRNYFALNTRGGARESAGRLEEALADYEAAILADPRFADGYFNRASVRRKRGDVDGALEDLSRVVVIDPGYSRAWSDRGSLRAERNEFAAAIADFDQAILLVPGSPEFHVNRGTARLVSGDPLGAAPDLERALDLAGPAWPDRERVGRLLDRARREASPRRAASQGATKGPVETP